MVPARQRLEAGDGAVFQPHDRLIEKRDLFALDGAAQIRFEAQPVGLARAHRRLEHFDAVAADALGVIHREFGVFEDFLAAIGLLVGERKADRRGEEDFAIVEGDRRAQGAADGFRECDDAAGIALGQQDQRELIAGQSRQGIVGLQQAAETPRQRQQDGVADRDADGIVDLLEAVEVDDHDGRPHRRIGFGESEHGLETVEEQLPVRQAGEIVVHGVVQQALFRGLEIGHVGERADEPHHFAVGADDRTRLEREPEIISFLRAQAEILHQAPAPLFDHAVERGAETVAVERMQHLEPGRGRAFERAALEAEEMFGLGAGEDLVGGDVPVPDHVARAGQRQRAALDVGDDAVGDRAREGMLHDREADQHHDQHEAAEQSGADNVVRDEAGNGQRRRAAPRPPAGTRSE